MSRREFLEDIQVSLSARMHLGLETTPEVVRRLAASLSRFDVIQSAAKLMFFMESVTGKGVRGSQETLLELFPSPLKEDLSAQLSLGSNRGGFDALFFPQQIMALQRLALAYGKDEAPTSFDARARWDDFLKLSALVSDLINDLGDFPITAAHKVLGVLPAKSLAAAFLRASAANRTTFFRAAGGRGFHLWLASPLRWPSGVPTAEDLTQDRYGVSLNRYLAIGLAPAFGRVAMDEPKPGEAPFDPRAYFGSTSIPLSEVTDVLNDLTFRPDPVTAITDPAVYWDVTPIADRPYLPAGGELLIPASVGKAFEKVTTGVFWMLHGDMAKKGDPGLLTTHFGHMFENYCLRMVQSVGSDHLHVTGEIEYGTRGRPMKSSDVLVAEEGIHPSHVFIECSAIRPRVGLFRTGDESAFDDYLERLVGKLGQLDRTVSDFRSGVFEVSDNRLPPGCPIFPVLIVDEPFEWSPQMKTLVQAEVNRHGWFRQENVAQPVVGDIGELEHLVAVVQNGSSMSALLRDYLSSGQALSVESFLHRTTGILDAPSFVNDGFQELGDLLLAELDFRT